MSANRQRLNWVLWLRLLYISFLKGLFETLILIWIEASNFNFIDIG